MSDPWEFIARPNSKRPLWFLVGIGAGGALLAAVRMAYLDAFTGPWTLVGLLVALLGVVGLYGVTLQVGADAYGLHSRTLLRRRTVPWRDIADLRVYIQRGRHQSDRRVSVALRDGGTWRLPLPASGNYRGLAEFDAQLEALRALHRRYGGTESTHVPVISYRASGRGSAPWLALCVLLLAGAGLAAWFVPNAESEQQAWRSAAPCTAATPAARRDDCLSTESAVIARTELNKGKGSSWLFFADGRPQERLAVSREGAEGFRAGDRVELTVWRDQVREVAGKHHVWREHFSGGGDVAVVAALCVLLAGYPAARVVLYLRGRRLPDDEVVPSALPFTVALAGTALWLFPLCYFHPTTLLSGPVPISWGAAGLLVTLGLFIWAWRATRVRTPGEPAESADFPKATAKDEGDDVFLAARFLDHTDYNPNGFGTHIVLGDDSPAVVPHSGPGRFAAKRIPKERLTMKDVRRVRGGDGDGDTVPRGWHVAELDDAGTPVRLAAAPADLTRLIGELGLTYPSTDAASTTRRV